VFSGLFTLQGNNIPGTEGVSGPGNGANGPLGDGADNLVVDFGFYNSGPLAPYDPPHGEKTVNASGLPELSWTMVWYNPNTVFVMPLQVVDPIPAGTTYVPGSLSCQARGVSTQTRCEYDAVLKQIVFEGLIGPDGANNTEATALNEVVITFRASIPGSMNAVSNQANAFWDQNGDGTVDPGPVPSNDPVTGAPGDPTAWARPAAGIPTLSEWSLIMLSGLLALGALVTLRRHRL
jgi:uncharacterized repeat protein (TIGR01451 family)